MIVIHAGMYDDGMAFWAESTDAGTSKERAGQDDSVAASEQKGRYVLSAGPSELQWILKMMLGSSARVQTTPSYILLPTRGGESVVPSGGILDDDDDDEEDDSTSGTAEGQAGKPAVRARGRTGLAEWWVETVILRGDDLITATCHVMGKRTVAPGIVVGADLAFAAEVLRFSGSIVARQQYLPDAEDYKEQKRTNAVALWRPIITGSDAARFDDLASRMPGAVWAFPSQQDGEEIPRGKPADILSNMIANFAGSIIHASTGISSSRKEFDSIHDAWLHHLKAADPRPMTGADAQQLSRQVRDWQKPVTSASAMPIRLCFRLEEPDKGSKEWFVRYMLQARDDPSLIVTAGSAWESESSVLPRGADAKEFLLTSLGRATVICDKIGKGLGTVDNGSGQTAIQGVILDSTGAYEFLTRDAAALEQAGYGVIFPAWWTGRGTKAKIKAKADVKQDMKAGGMLNLGTIVQFEWEIAIGDKNVTIEELERLAEAKSPLVRMRGAWVEVSPDDIKYAISILKKRSKKASLFDVIRMRLAGPDSAIPGADGQSTVRQSGEQIEVEITSSDGQIRGILESLDDKGRLEETEQPDGFCGELRPYQLRGFSWLAFLQKWGLGGCLADDMGLGKTIQILALVQQHAMAANMQDNDANSSDTAKGKNDAIESALHSNDTGTFFLVCPTSVISNWQREAAKFVPGVSVFIHHGTARTKNASELEKIANNHNIIVTSYGLLHRDIKLFKKIQWAGAVLDEAQNIKNPNTKQARASRQLKTACRFALTGTPVENNVGDLWSIMEFLNPGFLGTQAAFKRNYFLPIQTMQDEGAAERLKRATGPLILRRLKTDKSVISDLPEKIETKTYCTLTREQASLYKAILMDIERALTGDESERGIKRKGIILSALARLKQVCDHPVLFLKDGSDKVAGHRSKTRSGKIARLSDMLSEVIEAGDSALVFTQFVEMGHILKNHIQETFGLEVMFLHGGTPRGKRDEMVKRFQGEYTDEKEKASVIPRIFVISVKAGGTGLNLTAASHVFHFDRWWNPAVEDQATDRAFRIGQKKNVQVHKMICSGTLEEKIDDMIESKKNITRKVIGTGEGWITEMSNEDLRNVLALDAVQEEQ